MIFKKFRGQIFDVELNKKEEAALNEKINRYILETHKQFTDDFDYMILRVLHNHFGFGLKRLKHAFNLFVQDNEALIKHYETPDAGAYIARKEMNALGCDLEKWNSERSE